MWALFGRALNGAAGFLHVLAYAFDGVATCQHEGQGKQCSDGFGHGESPWADQANWRMSTKWPWMAAAAAMAGLTRWVRPPAPWRPSKLRLLVEAQRSPGSRRSAFMARHMLQPGSRHSKPAAVKISCRPSRSAWALTRPEPGTTMATLTLRATFWPSFCTTAAAARRSSMRLLVQLPMKILSTQMSVMGLPGSSAM